jgi:hypothetical protein
MLMRLWLVLLCCVPVWNSSANASSFNGLLKPRLSGSGLTGGEFAIEGSLMLTVLGSQIYVDINDDGLTDFPVPNQYSSTWNLDTARFRLMLKPGNGITVYNDNGPLIRQYDWALTAFNAPLFPWEEPTPAGSVLYGSADVLGDRTILHVSERLAWFDGIEFPTWGGYRLADFSAFELRQESFDEYSMHIVPAPHAFLALLLVGVVGARSRRR